MAFQFLETPRTEFGDQTRLAELDLTNQSSIPSPSKESNDVLAQIRGMGGPSITTPRTRPAFGDRRNLQSKNEFTPLLKSAARNKFMKAGAYDKENSRLQTPAGLKAGWGVDSPGLPLDSSVIMEEHTGSSAGVGDGSRTPQVPGTSSSAVSTPMAVLPRGGDGPLDNGRNLATLREQEARLEQIDKENFSLKLKIHFMEEALRKNGKEFNEAAIRENTELKVDKVTLQRDLKQNRKSLIQAQQDLEEYRKQFAEYTEKVKRRHVNEGIAEELDQLKQDVIAKQSEIDKLQQSIGDVDAQNDNLARMQDDINDMEAELREKDRELDEKDDELEQLRQASVPDENLQQSLSQKEEELQEKDEIIEKLQKSLQRSSLDMEQRLQTMSQQMTQKEKDFQALDQRSKSASASQVLDLQAKADDIKEKTRQIEALQNKLSELEKATAKFSSDEQQRDAEKSSSDAELRKKNRTIEEKDFEIHKLQQKLESVKDRDQEIQRLHDDISDLEAKSREDVRLLDERGTEVSELEEKIRKLQREASEQVKQARARVDELEVQQARSIKEVQALRDASNDASSGRHHALTAAQHQIQELEQQVKGSEEREKHLSNDVNKLHSQIRDVNIQVRNSEDKERQLSSDVNKLRSQVKDLEMRLKNEEAENDQQELQFQATIASSKGRVQELESKIQELELKIHEESEANEKAEEELQDEVNNLQNQLKDLESKIAGHVAQDQAIRDQWQSERRALELQKSEAEEQSNVLQRTIETLQDAQGSLSSREFQLKRALESEQTRFKSAEAVLHQELDDVNEESEQRRKSLEIVQAELIQVKEQKESASKVIHALREKVQLLEDEVEVLQSGLDEDVDRVKDELVAAGEESDEFRRQIKELQQSLAKKESQLKDLKAQLEDLKRNDITNISVSAGTPRPQRELRLKLQELNEQLKAVKQERNELQSRLIKAETVQVTTKVDLDTLQFDFEATSGSRSQLQSKLQDLQNQLSKIKKEKQNLQDSLALTNVDLDAMQSIVPDLEKSRDEAQQQARELRVQIQSLLREHERKERIQVVAYEQDIQNLEQELADADSKHDELQKANQIAQQHISSLENKIQTLEKRLQDKRMTREPSAEERKDLHEMLKDAKLEAEDLALQVKERDLRIENATVKETELRTQLKRLRDERATQSSRAITAAEELDRLQETHDRVLEDLANLKSHRQTLPTKTQNPLPTHPTPTEPLLLEKQTNRHKAELRGLVKQIEYLSARCRREEAFRRDLSYVKHFFTKQVEMYGRCTAADLRLVKAMGIPVDAVLEQQVVEGYLAAGRVVKKSTGVVFSGGARGKVNTGAMAGATDSVVIKEDTRPTFRVVAFMVLAGVKMKRAAEGWGGVRKGHEGLLRKLVALRREREGGRGNNNGVVKGR